jgi:hypothetical protein
VGADGGDDLVVELLGDVLAHQRGARRDHLDLLEREDLAEDDVAHAHRQAEEEDERRDADDDAERRQREVARAAQGVLRDDADELAGGHHAGPPPS